MNKTICACILILLSNPTILLSQIKKEHKHTISIDPLSCIDKTISLSYSYSLNDKYEVTFNPKVNFQSKYENTLFGLILIDDPYWYYDTYTLRVGIRMDPYRNIYIEPILYYKYGVFNNRTIKYEDYEGDAFDITGTLNRRYRSFGTILKCGSKYDMDHFRINFFYGIGYYFRKYNEEILQKKEFYTPIVANYPIKSTYWKNNFTIHLGFEIGFRF